MLEMLKISPFGAFHTAVSLVAVVAGLIADVAGVWIVSRAIPGLSDSPGPITGGESTALGHPQLLYYPAIAVMALLGVAGLFLVAYILTLLEKRFSTRR